MCLFELALASMPGLVCPCDIRVLRSTASQSPVSLSLSPFSLHALLAFCVLLCLGTAAAAFACAPCLLCFSFMFNATLWSIRCLIEPAATWRSLPKDPNARINSESTRRRPNGGAQTASAWRVPFCTQEGCASSRHAKALHV